MRANANKCRQKLTNASKAEDENASKHRQTQTDAYTPPFIAIFYTPPLQSPYSSVASLSGPTATVILSRYTVTLHSFALRIPGFGGVSQ